MKNLAIGLIGAQGNMGRALGRRFREVQGRGLLEGWTLRESIGHDNADLARSSDLILLTVKPGQVEAALTGVREAVRERTGLLSFAGVAPLEFLRSHFGGEVGRGMADLGFEQAMRCDGDERMKTLMDSLSEDACLETTDENAVDEHTTLVACNPGISAWHFLNNEARAQEWLTEHNKLTHASLGVSEVAMCHLQAKVFEEGDFQAKIEEVATKGGITEAMIKILDATKGGTGARALFEVGMNKIAQARLRYQIR
ncbi:MAG: hypothetical protein WC924_03515 [Candidatus Gracilibacteria bacterium]